MSSRTIISSLGAALATCAALAGAASGQGLPRAFVTHRLTGQVQVRR